MMYDYESGVPTSSDGELPEDLLLVYPVTGPGFLTRLMKIVGRGLLYVVVIVSLVTGCVLVGIALNEVVMAFQ